MKINIMIVDDHSMVREGLKQLLELDGSIEVVADAGNGVECIEYLKNNEHPDVLLLDINMPLMNGLEVLYQIHKLEFPVKVILLTVHSEVEYLMKALDIGINGYMLKDSSLKELVDAINTVYKGGTYIEPSMVSQMNTRLTAKKMDENLIDTMTKREVDVLKLLSLGCSNRDIAEKLEISERTVKNHIFNIFKKINVTDRTQAAIFAIKNHLIDIYEK